MGFAILDISSGQTIEESGKTTTRPLSENHPLQKSPNTQIVPFVPDGDGIERERVERMVIIQQIQQQVRPLV